MGAQRTLCSLLLLIGWYLLDVLAQQGCDRVFSSYQSGTKKGEFQSPGYPSHYPNGVSCKFKFIGRKGNERVKIEFKDFNLQGRSPICSNDFIHIYSQLKSESDDLLRAALTGPFCGKGTENLPSLVLSTNHVLIIWFYSNNQRSNNGFRGTYEFVEVDHGMPTSPPEICEYKFPVRHGLRGNIKSPTYPGVYPDNLNCHYHLQGRPGQRIKLTFEDFSLFYGDEYCPFDFLTIIDGGLISDPVIGKFCGSYNRSTVIYSSSETIRLEFVTGEDRLDFAKHSQSNADFQFERRGFNISFEFSDKFVKLDEQFVKPGSQHIRGTECDLRIMSAKESSGVFESPGYPGNFSKDLLCRYYLDGLMDEQNLERVKVTFMNFNIPGNMPYCVLGYLGKSNISMVSDITRKFCGFLNPPKIYSSKPRVVITLNTTGAVKGGRFSAKYNFITDYAIPGEQIVEGECKFNYPDTADTASGTFNSPRHHGIYPPNTSCEYIFMPRANMTVVIHFTVFVLSDTDMKHIQCSPTQTNIAFYEKNDSRHHLTERFCGQTFPGPYATSNPLKIVFTSDHTKGFVGFRARYFYKHKAELGYCGEHQRYIAGGGTGGVVTSPNYPSKYPSLVNCDWIITASKKENRIMAQITELNMEGEYGKKENKSSCENVAVRVYNGRREMQPMHLMCGRKKDNDADVYMSSGDSFKITFITSEASLGGRGFKISWTEIHTGASTMGCTGFQCAKSGFCIAPNLKCNKEPNCGAGDNSDETAECPKSSGISLLHIAIGSSLSSFVCILLLICGFYHRRKPRTERFPPDHDRVEVRYVSAPTGCNTTDRLLMEDRNDGNGNTMANENHNNSTTAAPTTATTQSPRCQKVSMV